LNDLLVLVFNLLHPAFEIFRKFIYPMELCSIDLNVMLMLHIRVEVPIRGKQKQQDVRANIFARSTPRLIPRSSITIFGSQTTIFATAALGTGWHVARFVKVDHLATTLALKGADADHFTGVPLTYA
jgi:hypothetical protein